LSKRKKVKNRSRKFAKKINAAPQSYGKDYYY